MENIKSKSPRPDWLFFSNRYPFWIPQRSKIKDHSMTMDVPINMWMGEQFPERGRMGRQANRCVPPKRVDSYPYLRGGRQLLMRKRVKITLSEYLLSTSYRTGWCMSSHYPGYTLGTCFSAHPEISSTSAPGLLPISSPYSSLLAHH